MRVLMHTKPRTNINELRMWEIRHLPVHCLLILNSIVKRVCQKLQCWHKNVASSYTALPSFLCSQTFEIQPQRWTARNRISLRPEDSRTCLTETAPKFWPTALREKPLVSSRRCLSTPSKLAQTYHRESLQVKTDFSHRICHLWWVQCSPGTLSTSFKCLLKSSKSHSHYAKRKTTNQTLFKFSFNPLFFLAQHCSLRWQQWILPVMHSVKAEVTNMSV
jgi:hypothetical protein